MTHNLCINDENNNTQQWWMNFLYSIPRECRDIQPYLRACGARFEYDRHGYSNTIIFDREEDLTWFLLKWA